MKFPNCFSYKEKRTTDKKGRTLSSTVKETTFELDRIFNLGVPFDVRFNSGYDEDPSIEHINIKNMRVDVQSMDENLLYMRLNISKKEDIDMDNDKGTELPLIVIIYTGNTDGIKLKLVSDVTDDRIIFDDFIIKIDEENDFFLVLDNGLNIPLTPYKEKIVIRKEETENPWQIVIA